MIFFSRFIKGLHKLDCELIFLTNSLSLYLLGIKRRIKIFLCKKSSNRNEEKCYLNSTEVLGKLLSEDEAEILYQSVLNSGEELVKRYGVNLIFIGNGSSTAQIAMKAISKKFNIPALFFENPNIPGKTFVDQKGVNAKSRLYENINLLNDFSVNVEDYQKFIDIYLKSRKSTNKKKKRFLSIENPYIILDYLGFLLLNLPKIQNLSLVDRFIKKFRYRSLKIESDKVSFQDKYIFYPLQVSSDSQLLLNSNISNIEALEFAYEESQKNGLKLIVKPHPKEKNPEVISHIISIKKQKNFLITNFSTLELVKHCELLITINSTVGLEAMIMGKKVIFLGKTFYKNLTQELIPKYICGYLLDFSYTSADDIPTEKIAEMFKRIEFKSE